MEKLIFHNRISNKHMNIFLIIHYKNPKIFIQSGFFRKN